MPVANIAFLDLAARIAWRGHGGAEPNPMVGCVIVDGDGFVVGAGAHMKYGGPHAEINALREAGDRARGATAYVTLEPCNHQGKTPPCSQALVDAGVTRVVYGQSDPGADTPDSTGGADHLRAAGIDVEHVPDHGPSAEVSAAFMHRTRTGLPWVVAKWAQTLDGRIATRTGASQWISGEQSRRMVHRERGRVDAILTGVGTVDADDPMLTARDVRVRRVARRVIIDPSLRTPHEAKLVKTAGDVPTIIACSEDAVSTKADDVGSLCASGVELLAVPAPAGEIPLAAVLAELVKRHDVTNVLVESGAGLLGRLFAEQLVNEAWVFVAPLLFGDADAMPPAVGREVCDVTDGIAMRLTHCHRRGDDLVLRYRV
jgi:diaminohydroxyphosphoribosylaminopyrimidine deaminase/5-amino-6-(5-phosphoribosylamino)uracil reductase